MAENTEKRLENHAEITLRSATEEDLEDLETMEKECFLDPWSRRSLEESFSDKNTGCIVAVRSGNILGYVLYGAVLDECEIYRIAVAKSGRRQGIGALLLKNLEEISKDHQIMRILLDVREKNEGARGFYASMGFSVDGVRKNFYQNPGDHAVLMSKVLK